MSRIIVKNLPIKATEDDLRKHFAKSGHITDVKVMRKRDGSSRRFAFVGFGNDEEAANAAKYFNLSFLNNSRLEVSLAKALGDESLARRKQDLKRRRLEQKDEIEGAQRKSQRKMEETDSKLNEFLSVMQPQKKTAMWKNDSTDPSAVGGGQPKPDDEDVNDLTAVKESETEDQENAEEEEEEEQEEEEWDPTANLADDDETKPDENISDLDWLKQRQTRIMENGEKPEPIELPEPEIEEEPVVNTTSNRLFLRNLSYTTSQGDLLSLFAKFGNVKQVHVPIDPKTDKSKGIAFVEFEDVAEAETALQELDGKSFQGRLLHIIYAQEQRAYVLDEFDIKNMPLKKQKALKRRMQASKQQFSWNSLYMRPDTVLEAAAAKLGISKSELMDPASSNMAVQQALAESSVLESVQSYFRSKGVDLSRFSDSSQLSDTVILVKNLPFATKAPEIQDMFAQFGEVLRTLMPPDGGIAIVQFKLASAGRQAFKKLAFRRVGDSIMYLQKAPKGVLDDPASETAAATAGTTEATTAAASTPAKKSAQDILLPANDEEDELDVRTSVFVKNLNFSTADSALAKLFQSIPGFITATIKTKPDPQNPGKKQSMGFGFVEFRSKAQAEVAVKTLQNHVLDGHGLELKISTRGADGPQKSSRPATSKIVIKNIPFETSKQDVVDLFGTFGKLRSVRVPRKFNRQTRGFAFAEFATPKEAEHAMSSLQGAHLLGRRLVMDYAQADAEDPEAEIARMEAKVAKQVSAEKLHGNRLGQQKGFDMDEE